MTCLINKSLMVALTNEVSEYLERYAAILPKDATVELEELGEQVTLAMMSAIAAIADDHASEIQMKGHVLYGAMHAGLFSALTSGAAAPKRPTNAKEITVN